MSDALKVQIENGSTRRRIIICALCEHFTSEFGDLSEDKRKVTDNEIYHVLQTLTRSERDYVSRKFQGTFVRNCNEALRRLFPPKPKK